MDLEIVLLPRGFVPLNQEILLAYLGSITLATGSYIRSTNISKETVRMGKLLLMDLILL